VRASSAVDPPFQMCNSSNVPAAIFIRSKLLQPLLMLLHLYLDAETLGHDARPTEATIITAMRFLIALLAIAGIFVSSRALSVHNEDPSVAPPCAVTATWDCGVVNHSRYAVFPATRFDEDPAAHKIHIPVAELGIIGYAVILLLALFKLYRLTLLAALGGFGFASYLTYLEAHVIEKWCIYCVWSMGIISTTLLVTIVAVILEQRRKRRFANSAVVVGA
jgi:vitamin-K-epoxide reductase (warfarin-sensitive)